MADIIEMIRRDVEDDVSLKIHGFTVDMETKGFLVKHKTVRVGGRVAHQHDRDKLEGIVNHHIGDSYTVDFNVKVEQPADA